MKHLAIAVKYMEDGESRTTFFKDAEIADGKADTMYSALSNEIDKCSRVVYCVNFNNQLNINDIILNT